jgi:isocitrate dehydrogenase
MGKGDFRSNEKSVTIPAATTARIEHVDRRQGHRAEGQAGPAGRRDPRRHRHARGALVAFLEAQVEDARKAEGVLFSLHLKATMMKVSDPIIFGHAVRAYFKDLFAKHGATFERLGVDPNNGFGDLVGKIASLPEAERAAIEADIAATYAKGPAWRWSTPTRASPTCTCRATSSSTRPCRP